MSEQISDASPNEEIQLQNLHEVDKKLQRQSDLYKYRATVSFLAIFFVIGLGIFVFLFPNFIISRDSSYTRSLKIPSSAKSDTTIVIIDSSFVKAYKRKFSNDYDKDLDTSYLKYLILQQTK